LTPKRIERNLCFFLNSVESVSSNERRGVESCLMCFDVSGHAQEEIGFKLPQIEQMDALSSSFFDIK